MINSERDVTWNEVHHKTLPLDHPLMKGRCINTPIYEQDYQWRMALQSFSHGGFEVRIVLVNRNALSQMHNASRYRGKRIKPIEKDATTQKNNDEKSAFRAVKKVMQLCQEIRVDRLLTFTSRSLLTDIDLAVAAWKKFIRLLERAGVKFLYVAVPELHKNGQHYHIHVAINGHVRVEILRRCWQIALGGKGNEKGVNAVGNVDIKRNQRKKQDANQHTLGIARYISKYITKDFLEQHQFNRKRYWASRGIKLPEAQKEWMQAETMVEALEECYTRFGPDIMSEAISNRIYTSNLKIPMIFFRYLPNDEKPLPIPF